MWMRFDASSSESLEIAEKVKILMLSNHNLLLRLGEQVEWSNVDKCVGAFLFCICCAMYITSPWNHVVLGACFRCGCCCSSFPPHRIFARFWDWHHFSEHTKNGACSAVAERKMEIPFYGRKMTNIVHFFYLFFHFCGVAVLLCGRWRLWKNYSAMAQSIFYESVSLFSHKPY